MKYGPHQRENKALSMPRLLDTVRGVFGEEPDKGTKD